MKKITNLFVYLLMAGFVFAAVFPENEPNDSIQSAQFVPLGDTVVASVADEFDVDFFRPSDTLQPGAYILTTDYPNGSPGFHDWFLLTDAAGNEIQPYKCYFLGGDVQMMFFKVCTPTVVYLRAQMNELAGQVTGQNYAFTIVRDNDDPECNDTPATATSIAQPGVQTSKIAIPGDPDWFLINGENGTLSVTINNPIDNLPMLVELYDSPTAASPIEVSVNGSLNTALPQTGTYYLRAKYADPDTSSRQNYLMSVIFTPAVIACEPEVGFSNYFQNGLEITLDMVLVNADSVVYNWGDGIVSGDPTHTYAGNGFYTVTATAYNACGTATATIDINVLVIECQIGALENQPLNAQILVPVVCINGEIAVAGLTGTVSLSNPAAGTFTGFQSGTLPMNNVVYNPANGYFATTFAAGGSNTVGIGDTLFYLVFQTGANAGDSTLVDLNGGLTFEFSTFVSGWPVATPTVVHAGSFSLISNIQIAVLAHTPTVIAVSNARIEISTPDTTVIGYTDANGKWSGWVPYADSIYITLSKDTTIFQGVSTPDAFLVNRIVVLLPINSTQYGYVAADFDCDGVVTVNDAIKILQYVVGLIGVPCDQIEFIPAGHVFPIYPDPDFFNYPTQALLVNPNADLGETVSFVCVVRGDVDHNANPGLQSEYDDRSQRQWTWQARNSEAQTVSVRLKASDAGALAAGGLNVNFDAGRYQFLGARMLQAQHESLFIVNDRQSDEGRLRMALMSQTGQNLPFDAQLPLIEMTFRAKTADLAEGFDLNLSEKELVSQVFDAEGETFGLHLLRENETAVAESFAAFKAYPNPAAHSIYVSLPEGAAQQIECRDASGRLMYQADDLTNYQVQIDVSAWPSGLYAIRVLTHGKTYRQIIEVMSGN